MRILVLCKRQYTGRDLLDDRFGRLYELPRQLAALGHAVRGIAYSYRPRPESAKIAADAACPEWMSLNGLPFLALGGWRHLRHIEAAIGEFSPDLVWCSSDSWNVSAGWRACRTTATPYVVDLYDNYESFGLARLPFARNLIRTSCRHAAGITAVSHALAELVRSGYGIDHLPVSIIGNASRADFFPLSRAEARKSLGLPDDALLIGTAGALDASRDIGVLFQAFRNLVQQRPDARLVVAGPRDGSVAAPLDEHVIDLGVLPPDRIPAVFSALDIGVICNRDSAFGRYCYPQKYEEMVACGLPVVAADVGEMSRIMGAHPGWLYAPGSSESLMKAISLRLDERAVPVPVAATWPDRAEELSRFFDEVLYQARASAS